MNYQIDFKNWIEIYYPDIRISEVQLSLLLPTTSPKTIRPPGHLETMSSKPGKSNLSGHFFASSNDICLGCCLNNPFCIITDELFPSKIE
uniref:Uncharacterized protein n=1 Tax=Romanomermis culicivorax TaxID=13658 RepID=A0A915IL43_ROMCU